MNIRVHRFLPFTRVEGPGNRACIWVQGCPIHCPGCAVPWTWPEAGGDIMTVNELFDEIMRGPEIEGVTFVGGEPFAQASALAKLGRRLQDSQLSIVTFTGYEIEHIRSQSRGDWDALLEVTDLLIDGPFRQDLAETSRLWVGSKNQRFHFLTPRYTHLAAEVESPRNKLEVRIEGNGVVRVNGLASQQQLRELFGDDAYPRMSRADASSEINDSTT